MDGFAGVVVTRAGLVLLVQEPDYFSGDLGWTIPSGHIDDGETPAVAASRELAEEAGCAIDAADLQLFSVADVTCRGALLNTSWNFTAETVDPRLGPAGPDDLVVDARWFARDAALELISESSYAPKREPMMRFLASGEFGLRWRFEMIDPDAAVPSFSWDPPTR